MNVCVCKMYTQINNNKQISIIKNKLAMLMSVCVRVTFSLF